MNEPKKRVIEDIAGLPVCGALGGHDCPATEGGTGRHWCAVALVGLDGSDERIPHEGRHRCRCAREFDVVSPMVENFDSPMWVIAAERRRAMSSYPDQTYPNGTGGPWATMFALESQGRVDDARAAGSLTWRDVLDLKVAQLSAQTDPVQLAGRLAQAAAVCALWMEDLRRQVREQERAEAARREKKGNQK